MSSSVLSKTGWVEKRGKLRKGWKRRWMMFRPDGALAYFKSIQDLNAPAWGEVRGAIPLDAAAVAETETPDKDGKYAFSISVTGRVFHLRVPSRDVRDAWISALQGAILLAANSGNRQDADDVDLSPESPSQPHVPTMFGNSGAHFPVLQQAVFAPPSTTSTSASASSSSTVQEGGEDRPEKALGETWDDILGL